MERNLSIKFLCPAKSAFGVWAGGVGGIRGRGPGDGGRGAGDGGRGGGRGSEIGAGPCRPGCASRRFGTWGRGMAAGGRRAGDGNRSRAVSARMCVAEVWDGGRRTACGGRKSEPGRVGPLDARRRGGLGRGSGQKRGRAVARSNVPIMIMVSGDVPVPFLRGDGGGAVTFPVVPQWFSSWSRLKPTGRGSSTDLRKETGFPHQFGRPPRGAYTVLSSLPYRCLTAIIVCKKGDRHRRRRT